MPVTQQTYHRVVPRRLPVPAIIGILMALVALVGLPGIASAQTAPSVRAEANTGEPGRGKPGTFVQVSVIGAIAAGVYDGSVSVRELALHGNFGLGATHALGGEMVVYDGEFYEVGTDGRARRMGPEERVAFAAVTFFDPEAGIPGGSLRLPTAHTSEELEQHLLSLVDNPGVPYAVWVKGRFTHVKTRTPLPQTKPYPALADVLVQQVEFDLHDVEGTMVGFWTPDYLKDIHSPGFHFHFITAEDSSPGGGRRGGHVLAYETAAVAVAVAPQRRMEILFPMNDPDFASFAAHPLR